MITDAWAKSAHSNPNGACLEARWHKSSYSAGGNCVEARQAVTVQVRDSVLGEASPVLEVPPAAWRAFLDALR